jgi:hypothetical protein
VDVHRPVRERKKRAVTFSFNLRFLAVCVPRCVSLIGDLFTSRLAHNSNGFYYERTGGSAVLTEVLFGFPSSRQTPGTTFSTRPRPISHRPIRQLCNVHVNTIPPSSLPRYTCWLQLYHLRCHNIHASFSCTIFTSTIYMLASVVPSSLARYTCWLQLYHLLWHNIHAGFSCTIFTGTIYSWLQLYHLHWHNIHAGFSCTIFTGTIYMLASVVKQTYF